MSVRKKIDRNEPKNSVDKNLMKKETLKIKKKKETGLKLKNSRQTPAVAEQGHLLSRPKKDDSKIGLGGKISASKLMSGQNTRRSNERKSSGKKSKLRMNNSGMQRKKGIKARKLSDDNLCQFAIEVFSLFVKTLKMVQSERQKKSVAPAYETSMVQLLSRLSPRGGATKARSSRAWSDDDIQDIVIEGHPDTSDGTAGDAGGGGGVTQDIVIEGDAGSNGSTAGGASTAAAGAGTASDTAADNEQGGTSATTLKEAADAARHDHPRDCSGATAQVAQALGHPELEGKQANQQIQYMRDNWKEVSSQKAQELANQGELVVAGLQSPHPENPSEHGHTVPCVPGNGATKDGYFYPNVEGGAMNQWAYDHSTGNYTAGDVWRRDNGDATRVKYFTPESDSETDNESDTRG